MTAQVEILTGVAGAGKTETLLNLFRDHLKQPLSVAAPGSGLWLSPTERARERIFEQLLEGSPTGCLEPRVLTFDDFAERILAESSQEILFISETGKRALLRNIINQLRREKKIPYFYGISLTTGFLDLVAGFIAELKREEIWPERFSEACEVSGSRFIRRDSELCLIYEQYQEHLLRTNRYDTEGRFWWARTLLDSGTSRQFQNVSLVIADGFSDFTCTQREILKHLARWSQQLKISLPAEDPPTRKDLFGKTERQKTLLQELLEGEYPVTVRHLSSAKPTSTGKNWATAHAHIARHLFAGTQHFEQLKTAHGLNILEVNGQFGEVRVLAGKIKKLLVDGVPPQEIVVAFRNVARYRPWIDDIWKNAGIPFWCDVGIPLASTPIVRSLFSLIQLEADDWPFDRLLDLLSSSYLDVGWDCWQEGTVVRTLSRFLRRWTIPGERRVILRAIERGIARSEDLVEKKRAEENELPPKEKEALKKQEEDLQQLKVLQEFLNKFEELTEPLRQRQTFADWVAALLSIANELGFPPIKVETVSDEISDTDENSVILETEPEFDEVTPDASELEVTLKAREILAWNRFTETLEAAVRAEELLDMPAQTLTLTVFQQRLTDLLKSQEIPPEREPRGCVRILNAQQIRNLDIPYLFLAGLTETSFPQPSQQDAFYNDYERHQLHDQGLELGHQTQHGQEEMLLFYRVITRARKQLTLSYPAVGPAGEPLFPSPYLNAVTELFEPDAVLVTHIEHLDPVPENELVLTAADWRVRAAVDAREQSPALFRTFTDTEEFHETGRNILAAMDLYHARFQTRGFTRFEGRIRAGSNLQELVRRYPAGGEFSATQLENISKCGFRFFMGDVLRIPQLNTPHVATDYIGRGILVHRVMANLHRKNEEGNLPTTAEEIQARFEELSDTEIQRWPENSDLVRSLLQIERELLFEWAEVYAGQWQKYQEEFGKLWDAPPEPVLLEVAFGDVPDEEEAHDETFPSQTFGTGSEATRVRGRIDRIDAGTLDGKPVFNIIDYKTGSPPRFNLADIEAGRALQLGLYLIAVKRLGLIAEDSVPFQMGYWCVKEKGFEKGLKDNKSKITELGETLITELENLFDEMIPQLTEKIRTGQFFVYNTDEQCTSYCPYNTICRVNQIRPLEKSLRKQPFTAD